MIYSGNSLRKRFVSGRYTLIFLLGGATLLWLAGALTGLSAAVVRPILLANYAWMDSVVSLLLFAGAALVLNSFVIIEGRNSWLGGLVVWLAGLFCNVQEVSVSLSTLLLMLLLTVLFNCYPRDGVQRWLYAAFALLGFCSLLQPQLLYLIPLFFVYISLVSVLNVRGMAASLLGLATSFWLLWVMVYVFPQSSVIANPLLSGLERMSQFEFLLPVLSDIILLSAEVLVMLPAVVVFAGSASPAKPLMRKVFSFFMVMNFYLWVLSWLRGSDFDMLLAWRLPGIALMMGYLFTVGKNKLSNIYFVFINIIWIIVALLGIWR